jgi:hypothetical protein
LRRTCALRFDPATPGVVNPKAETRDKRHNGAERCLPSRSRINRGRKWGALRNSTRASVKQPWTTERV